MKTTAAKVEAPAAGQVQLSGELTFASVLQVRTPLLNQLEAAGDACTLDLSGVTRVDSSALSLWLVCQRHASQRKQQLKLSGIPADFRAIAVLVGLGDQLD
ncbi:MAG: STAS domain-containing protein [Oceanospirillales bacterium]|nr:STAS domain-containing protein [Oceanospirillales bacterium]